MSRDVEQQILVGVRHERVTISRLCPSGWRVRYADGTDDEWDGADDALRSVHAKAARDTPSGTVVSVKWLNVPLGWTPPTL